MTSFAEGVYTVVRTIPCGRVTTYQAVAHALGCRAYRAVGGALAKNPYAPQVPCHRVVRSDGTLGGFGGATDTTEKRALLKAEGIRFDGDQIRDFDRVYVDVTHQE